MRKPAYYFVAACVIVFLAKCTSDTQQQKTEQEGAEQNAGDSSMAHKDDIKVYTLPAPLQIPTAVKNLSLKYSENLLVPTNQSTATFPTNYLKAVNLGIFGIDMGYATVYEKHQSAIYYLSKIQKLSDELGIIGGFQPSTAERFKNNLKNQDSLYYIILETFNHCHKYLKENDRNDVGLLILTGSYIEGLYLTTKKTQENYNVRTVHLIARQQVFLDNLIELLGEYGSQKEIADLLEQMQQLKEKYKGVKIKEGDTAMPPAKSAPEISREQINEITVKISEIRNKITG